MATHQPLAQMSNQDRLVQEGLLRTESGSYYDMFTLIYRINGQDRHIETSALVLGQDRLHLGQVRVGAREYHTIDAIEGVERQDYGPLIGALVGPVLDDVVGVAARKLPPLWEKIRGR